MRTVFVLVDFWTPKIIVQITIVQQACLCVLKPYPCLLGETECRLDAEHQLQLPGR